MNPRKTHSHATICLALMALGAVSARAGDLEPPGPPAPTMKTLQEVEPRVPISSLPFTISQPGSYYLTGDLTGASGQNGILVKANDITIDLMGFTLQGVPGSGSGITTDSIAGNIVIRNGRINGWGRWAVEVLAWLPTSVLPRSRA